MLFTQLPIIYGQNFVVFFCPTSSKLLLKNWNYLKCNFDLSVLSKKLWKASITFASWTGKKLKWLNLTQNCGQLVLGSFFLRSYEFFLFSKKKLASSYLNNFYRQIVAYHFLLGQMLLLYEQGIEIPTLHCSFFFTHNFLIFGLFQFHGRNGNTKSPLNLLLMDQTFRDSHKFDEFFNNSSTKNAIISKTRNSSWKNWSEKYLNMLNMLNIGKLPFSKWIRLS